MNCSTRNANSLNMIMNSGNNKVIRSEKVLDKSEKDDFIRKAMKMQGYSSKEAEQMVSNSRRMIVSDFDAKEYNRQKVTEGIMKYFDGLFPLIEKDDVFRFSMYTEEDDMIGVEVFKDYIFVGLFNLDGKNNLDEYIRIPRENYSTIENEILYDSDAIFEFLEENNLVR